MFSRLCLIAIPLALSGCLMVVPVPVPLPNEDACRASELQDLVGQDASVLDSMRFGGVVRVILPGMAVTMDYAPARLNIEVDENRAISRVSCG